MERAAEALRPSLRPVVNATGVLIHTNLGRAPLATAAVDAVARAARGSTNLELDLDTGRRGGRDEHVGRLLRELTGAQDALVVNNGAAAALLAAAALAGPGRGIAVSRGQLVEIGGGFRIPDVVRQAGARLVEVGTTNRTPLADYARGRRPARRTSSSACTSRTSAPSGFVAEVGVAELVHARRARHRRRRLGGPGLAARAGRRARRGCTRRGRRRRRLLQRRQAPRRPAGGDARGHDRGRRGCRRHPLARAMRVGRLPLAALAATLALYRDPARALRRDPGARHARRPPDDLARRADALARATDGGVVAAVARVGGGALPLLDLHGPAVSLPDDPEPLARALRLGDPAVVARIADGRLLLDPRTLRDDEIGVVAAAVPRHV